MVKDCPNCGGIHYGQFGCPYSQTDGAAMRAGGYQPVERTEPVQAGISGEANQKGEPNGKAQIRLTGLA